MNFTPGRARPSVGEPGSTPFRSSSNRFRSSLVPMSRNTAPAARSSAGTQNAGSKLTGFSTTQRDLFRTTSTPKAQPFAPELPAAASYKTAGARKLAPPSSVLNGMNTTGAKELFQMRIPSPDPELSGAVLASQVPDDPSKSGSVYADQFLADKCPAHFDDDQRRQFFCILDLRRLKYAADEIFAKKDWKLNMLSFAKEYEKSRSIILLRYGLYEFKNVKPNPEMMRKWRLANGLPEEDDSVQASRTKRTGSGSGKRKAEDEGASTLNQNKRQNTEENSRAFSTNKRRAVDEDEQQSTPSAATSAFAKILEKTQSPAKRPVATTAPAVKPFSTPKDSQGPTVKSNPFGSTSTGNTFATSAASIFSNPAKGASEGSILGGHKVGTVPTNTSGIFSYLSESSNNSGNEIDDDDEEADEAEDDEGEENSESASRNDHDSQEASSSLDASAAVSTGTNTPSMQSGSGLFPASTSSSATNIFGAAAQSNGAGAKGGLFGRVKMGSDGQPLRATPGLEDKENSTVETQKETPAKPAGGNFTFDASSTPISFGAPAAKPASSMTESVTKENPSFGSAASTKPSSIFGAQGASAPASAPLFGPLSNPPDSSAAKPSTGAAPLFGTSKSATPAAPSSIFTNAGPAKEAASATAPKAPASIFAGFGANSSTPAQSTPSFGTAPSKRRGADDNDEPSAKRPASGDSKPSAGSIFGTSAPTFGASKVETQTTQSASSIFGSTVKPASSSTVFGNASGSSSVPAENSAKPLFGVKAPTPSAASEAPKTTSAAPTSLFGASSTPAEKPSFQFGASQPAPAVSKPAEAPAKSIFANAAPAAGGIFNFGGSTPTAPEAKPAAAPAPSFTFGAAKPAEPVATGGSASFSFGGTTNASPAVSFGATPSGAGSQSFDFNFGGGSGPGASSTFNFGAGGGNGGSASSSFTFGAGGGSAPPVNNPFAQANGAGSSAPIFGAGAPAAPVASTPKPATSFNFSFGGSQAQTPAQSSPMFGSQPNGSSTTNGGPSFSFGQATPKAEPAAAPKPMGIFGSLAPPGGEGSTRGGSPFPVASSLGATPVNGTPEPQTQEDGDAEAPQAQLSLTDGGPGEEDEECIHEVRAKATKYIPIDKNADEEDRPKSPWSTQGVGPLRVLKNKSTGLVRVLLRKEPSGNIALNKAILAGVDYVQMEKQIKCTFSKDDGSGLEQWLLQVKTAAYAKELRDILEANKPSK